MPHPAALPRAGQGIKPVPVGAAGIVARLDECDRGDLTQPAPFRGELGQGDHPPLHLSIGDLLPGRVTGIPQPQAVVVHHPGTAEDPRQGLLLPRRRVKAIPVPHLHDTRACHRPLTITAEDRHGRHLVSALHVHMVFVTKYRRGGLDADTRWSCQDTSRRCAETPALSRGSSTTKSIICARSCNPVKDRSTRSWPGGRALSCQPSALTNGASRGERGATCRYIPEQPTARA